MNPGERKKIKAKNPRQLFRPALFWDAMDIDMEKHAPYIIARILDYGDENDIQTLRSVYSNEQLIDVIKKRRGLMPHTARFWALYFNIPPEEIACLKKYSPKRP